MDRLLNSFISSFAQLGVVLAFSFFIYIILRLIYRNKISFFKFLDLTIRKQQFDKTFLLIISGLSLFAVANAFFQFYFSPTLKSFQIGDSSPTGKILKDGFGLIQVVSGFLYCFVQSGGAEEILFRGLFAKPLFHKFGFALGNVIQALIFWVMHLLLFRLITGDWISWIQFYIFLISFGMGLTAGFVNYRKGGDSIAPSWIVHGTVNFVGFLTLGFLTH